MFLNLIDKTQSVLFLVVKLKHFYFIKFQFIYYYLLILIKQN